MQIPFRRFFKPEVEMYQLGNEKNNLLVYVDVDPALAKPSAYFSKTSSSFSYDEMGNEFKLKFTNDISDITFQVS